jgi:phage repressor protein C with HTH and peptisase S24 domain
MIFFLYLGLKTYAILPLIMLTHDTIWLAIDRLAQSCGYSTSGLAKKAGLDPTSFNRSKRIGADGKPRWPSTESISRILNATDSTMSEFIDLIATHPTARHSPARIPVINIAFAQQENAFDDKGFPTGTTLDYIHFPQAPEDGLQVFALEVSGNAMRPVFREGDRLILAPDAPLRRGDRVVVCTKNGDILAKELARHTASKVELKSLHADDDDLSFSAKDINWIARIVWVSQ